MVTCAKPSTPWMLTPTAPCPSLSFRRQSSVSPGTVVPRTRRDCSSAPAMGRISSLGRILAFRPRTGSTTDWQRRLLSSANSVDLSSTSEIEATVRRVPRVPSHSTCAESGSGRHTGSTTLLAHLFRNGEGRHPDSSHLEAMVVGDPFEDCKHFSSNVRKVIALSREGGCPLVYLVSVPAFLEEVPQFRTSAFRRITSIEKS
mmetsp:Transcript_7402/g.20297  ORF Transcript_7402/g.20297 Transcript_7402/m.20297 type:complete len:202 (-) Transcript_7402:9-614(-)